MLHPDVSFIRVRSISVAFLLAVLLIASVPAGASSLVETNGLWLSASPQFFGLEDSGTYYNPTSIEANGYSFLFTQGGQFSSSTSPVAWCGGDMTILWRTPLSHTGLQSAYAPLRRVSPCQTTSSTTVHWGTSSALESQTGSVLVFAERQTIDKTTHSQTSSEVWLLEGQFNASGNDITTWSANKLFSVDSSVPGKRILALVLTDDTSRTAPNDGYLHEMYRGFARRPSYNTVELRMDFSQKYCDQGNSSSPQLCVLVEFKTSSGWTPVLNGNLDFTPSTKLAPFIPGDIVSRNGVLEFWGKEIVAGNNCPCDRNTNAARYRWYTINPSTFALSGSNVVYSQLRCMPAEPHNFRTGVDLIVFDGTYYLVSGRNDDQACSDTRTFVGQDTVMSIVQ